MLLGSKQSTDLLDVSAALVLEPLEQAFRDGIAAVHPIAPDVLELIGHACQTKQGRL